MGHSLLIMLIKYLSLFCNGVGNVNELGNGQKVPEGVENIF